MGVAARFPRMRLLDPGQRVATCGYLQWRSSGSKVGSVTNILILATFKGILKGAECFSTSHVLPSVLHT
jgi:hypothetical protein